MITELREYLNAFDIDDCLYISWDYDGWCDGWMRPPEYKEESGRWNGGGTILSELDNLLSGEAATRRYYKIDDPDDSDFIMALMRL